MEHLNVSYGSECCNLELRYVIIILHRHPFLVPKAPMISLDVRQGFHFLKYISTLHPLSCIFA